MEPTDLKSALESVLFVSNRPLAVKEIANILGVETAEAKQALDSLVKERSGSGIVLLEMNGAYQLATNAKNSTLVKNFLNADLREKLTDATVEVLSIIAYRQPISKSELEAIRGVNSQYSLRTLLMRGLIEKIPNPLDARGFLYQTTTEFLQHLGLISIGDLPEFQKLVGEIKLPQTPQLQTEIAGPVDGKPEGPTQSDGLTAKTVPPDQGNNAAEENEFEEEDEDDENEEE